LIENCLHLQLVASNFWATDFGHLSVLFSDDQIQEKLEVEKRKLEELEADHQETCVSMKVVSANSDEQAAIMHKHLQQQYQLERQRSLLDDLEFQMFEASVPLFLVIDYRQIAVSVLGQTSRNVRCIAILLIVSALPLENMQKTDGRQAVALRLYRDQRIAV